MKYALLLSLLVLTGCQTNPAVKHAFPSPPERVAVKCPQLKVIADDEEKLSELLKVVAQNYTTYYDCAVKHDALIEWVNIQRKLHDDVFNKE